MSSDFAQRSLTDVFGPNGKEGERQEFPAGGDSEEELLNTFQMSYIKKESRSGMLHLTKGCHVFDWEMLQTLGY